MDELVPIGRFSRISRLSIKALRLYDELGLLAPAWVDPATGYRYYRPGQANRAEAIRVLRLVDMPLDEIRELLADDDPDTAAKRLSAHRERLEERLADQQRMLRFLQRLIDRGGQVMPYAVDIKQVPAQPVASWATRTSIAGIGEVIGRGCATLFEAIVAAGSEPAGPPFVVYHDVIDDQNDGGVEVCFPVLPGVVGPAGPAGGVVWKELAGGPVAYTVHRGPYDEIAPAYHTVAGWAHDHGHGFAGPPREIYVNDPQLVAPEDLLTEVQFPIEAA
ncbi:MAG: MerR family transcriptional regulator [Acidimicrobiales bacterium]